MHLVICPKWHAQTLALILVATTKTIAFNSQNVLNLLLVGIANTFVCACHSFTWFTGPRLHRTDRQPIRQSSSIRPRTIVSGKNTLRFTRPQNHVKTPVLVTNLIHTKIISAFLQTKLVKISPASCQNCIKICVLPGHGFDNLLLA